MRNKHFQLFTWIALVTLLVSLMFPAIALADDGTPSSPAAPATGASSSSQPGTDPASPSAATQAPASTSSTESATQSVGSTSTDTSSTQVAATQAPASTSPTDSAAQSVGSTSTDIPSTQSAETQAPTGVSSTDAATQSATTPLVDLTSTDATAAQLAATPAPTTATSTDVAAEPAVTQTPSPESTGQATADATEAAVTALANSGSILTDQNGNVIPLASTQAADVLGQSLPDPVVCPAGSTSASAAGCVHGYTTISSAILAAAAGSVIFVESGTYTEQVVIDKSLTLTGAGSASTFIQAPATMTSDADGNKNLIEVTGATTVANISGFTIEGPGPSGCHGVGMDYGIYVRGGATANISNNTITHVRTNPAGGCQNGVAIRVGSKAAGQTGTAKITNNVISDYQKGGIVIDNTGSYADIEDNLVQGLGETTVIAQNGIQISRGATATLLNNTIEDNLCDHASCGPDIETQDQSAGILLYQSGNVSIQNNTVRNNDQGLYSLITVLGGSASAKQNTFEDNRYENILADQGTLDLQNNTITGGNYGVWAYSFLGDTGNTVVNLNGNQISNALIAGIRLDKDSGQSYNPVINGSGNTFTGNPAGVINDTTTLADFVGNWWDSATGPVDGKSIPDACGLTQNNPLGTGNGVSPCVQYDPWLTANPSAGGGGTGGAGGSGGSAALPPAIPVTGAEPTPIGCDKPSVTSRIGDIQVTFTGLCGYEVVLAQLSKDSLLGNLSQGTGFVAGVSYVLLKDGKAVDVLPAGASVQVSYLKPSGNASVLAWIDSSWVVQSASVIDNRIVANFDTPVANVVMVH